MPANIKLNTRTAGKGDVAPNTQNLIKRYEMEFKRLFAQEVKNILKSGVIAEPIINKTINILEQMQAQYWGGSSNIADEDPTALAREEQIQAVSAEILKNVALAAKSFNPESMSINIVHLSDEFLGVKGYSKKSQKRIVWLHFFLFGSLDDNLMWVNNETYEALFKKGKSSGGLGRFGAGFLLHITNNNKPVFINKLIGAGLLKEGESLDKFIHPQSGKKGHNYFKGILKTIDFNSIVIRPALEAARIKLQNNALIGKYVRK